MVKPGLWAACLAGGLVLSAGVVQAAPQRVVSINLCTDQLALQLAAPGQLVSVSYLAHDPATSTMAAAAAAIPANRGSAEEVFLLRPDLVLAGAYTAPDTLRLLKRLGAGVVLFQPETSLQDIRDNTRLMGNALGRKAEAEALITRFDAGLAALGPAPEPRPDAVIYGANGYAAGPDSLAGAILEAAGYRNIAADFGIAQGGTLPLEQLLVARPDLVVLSARNPGHSRSEQMMDHPALRALAAQQGQAVIADRNWICGTPGVLDAIHVLRDARRAKDPA